MLASFTSSFSNPHGLRIDQVWLIKIRFFDNPITRSIGTPACLTTKQAGFFLSSFVPNTISGFPFLPFRGMLSLRFVHCAAYYASFLFPLGRMSSDDFFQKIPFSLLFRIQKFAYSKKLLYLCTEFED